MPENIVGWAQYGWFFGGAAGGWLVLALFVVDQIRSWKFRRKHF